MAGGLMATEVELSPADAHPRAAELLVASFFWDLRDDAAPFGNETGAETLGRFRAFRDERESESPLILLAELLATWEVADAHWDATTADAVAEAGAEDEFSLLMRDEIILALAFAELIEEGRIDREVQRRAVLATIRQALPLVLAPWGDRALARASHLDKMRHALGAAAPS
jgi:uncharacterized protein YfeS